MQFSIDMFQTCNYRIRMSKMIQVRNVPDRVHRKLKARAGSRSGNPVMKIAEAARTEHSP